MLEMGQTRSHSVAGIAGGRLVMKLCCRKHVASGAIPARFCCCEGRDPQSGGVHVHRLSCPVCSAWPIVWGRVEAGVIVSPPARSPDPMRQPRSIGASLNWLPAEKLETHSLGRGAAGALM